MIILKAAREFLVFTYGYFKIKSQVTSLTSTETLYYSSDCVQLAKTMNELISSVCNFFYRY